MTSLTNILATDPTLDAADRALEKKSAQEKPRTYLGMSQIGDSCSRKLWYSFRWAGREAFDAMTLKRFADGHRTEDLIIDRLKLVDGLDIVAMDGANQIRVTDHGGHFSGHLDGTIVGLLQAPKTPHVLEIKCCGDKTFAKLKKCIAELGEKQALRAWNEVYYAQAQAYMGYMGYTRHYIVVATAGGRDWVSARTEADPVYFLQVKAKAARIIDAQEPPERISNKPDWYECKWCTYRGICHEQETPDRTCRTCLHSETMSEGRWHCQRWGSGLTAEVQLDGCPAHKFIPALVPGEVASATDKGVTYKLHNGGEWYDGE